MWHDSLSHVPTDADIEASPFGAVEMAPLPRQLPRFCPEECNSQTRVLSTFRADRAKTGYNWRVVEF